MTSIYTVLGSLAFMWRISKPMILVFAVTVPVSILVTRYRSKKVRPLFSLRSRKLGELNGFAEEMLSGCRTISAYGREETICERFNARNTEAMDAYYRAEYNSAALGPSVNFINNLSISLITILGGILYMYTQSGAIAAGSVFFITLGGVSKFVQYSRKIAGPINEFANILHEFQSAFSAAERVFRVIDEAPEPVDAPNAASLDAVEGRVEFDGVSFGYTPQKQILHEVSVEAAPGKTVAIVGPTGAGKTTIINLLMRFTMWIRVRSASTARRSHRSSEPTCVALIPWFCRIRGCSAERFLRTSCTEKRMPPWRRCVRRQSRHVSILTSKSCPMATIRCCRTTA
jgi:ATP-binding cassette subfamily B protein